MTALPPAPEEGPRISGAFRSLICVAFSELRRDLVHLLESGWSEAVRRRAEELAATLEEACSRRGMVEAAAHARRALNLARLSKATAVPILAALREEFDALERETQKTLSKQSKRFHG